MEFSDKDIEQLKTLHTFLSQSFKGASFGSLKIDNATLSLQKAIDKLVEPKDQEAKQRHIDYKIQVNSIVDLQNKLEANKKENKRLLKDHWIQNKCIADQHDKISELRKQLDDFNNGSRLF